MVVGADYVVVRRCERACRPLMTVLEELKEKPIDEVLPILKRKAAEWERRWRALPLLGKWLLMQLKRLAYRRARRGVIVFQARWRGMAARRQFAPILARARDEAARRRHFGPGTHVQRLKDGSLAAASSELGSGGDAAAVAREWDEVEAEVKREMQDGLASGIAWGDGGSGGDDGELPELLSPAQLQALLAGQPYAMMETAIEAILVK